MEGVLEVFVQDIEETVGETPKEEEGSDEDESPNWVMLATIKRSVW